MFKEQILKNFLKLYTGLSYVRETPIAIIRCSVLRQVQSLFQNKFFG
jgi:hypothetical protein